MNGSLDTGKVEILKGFAGQGMRLRLAISKLSKRYLDDACAMGLEMKVIVLLGALT